MTSLLKGGISIIRTLSQCSCLLVAQFEGQFFWSWLSNRHPFNFRHSRGENGKGVYGDGDIAIDDVRFQINNNQIRGRAILKSIGGVPKST